MVLLVLGHAVDVDVVLLSLSLNLESHVVEDLEVVLALELLEAVPLVLFPVIDLQDLFWLGRHHLDDLSFEDVLAVEVAGLGFLQNLFQLGD